MKRFLSFFCALSIILSVSAVPVKPVDKKAAQSEKSISLKQDKAAKSAVKTVNFGKAKKSTKVAHVKEPNFNGKTFQAAQKQSALLKAKKADIELTFAEGEIEFVDNCAAQGWWQLQAEDADYYITLSNLELIEEASGTYAAADLDSEYSFLWDEAAGDYVDFVEGSVTVAVDEAGNAVFTGSLVGSDENTYILNIVYTKPILPDGGNFEMASISETFFSYDNDVYVVLTDAASNKFIFDIVVDSGLVALESGKEYTLDDMLADYSYASYSNIKVTYTEALFTKTVAEDGSLEVYASFVDENENLWTLHYAQGAPTLREDTLTLNGSVAIGSSYSQIIAADEDTTQYISLLIWETDLEGQWSASDFYAGYTYVALWDAEEEAYAFFGLADSADITITFNEEANTYAVAGTLLTVNDDDPTDFVLFTIDLTIAGPEPIVKTREESITITDAKLVIYPDYGDWQVTGFNADSSRYVSIDILGDLESGEFTIDDIDDYYTYIYNVFERNDSLLVEEEFVPVEVNVTVAFNEEDSTAVITGTYLGQGYSDKTDVPEFTLSITAKVSTYVKPEGNQYDAETDFIVDFEDYTINDEYASQGVLFISAMTEELQYISLELWLPEGATELEAGDYVVSAEEYVPQTITACELSGSSLYGSFAGNLTATGQISIPLWFFAEGTVTVNDDLSISVDAINSKGAAIKCNLTPAPEGVEETEATVKATKRVVKGQLIIEKNGIRYNAQGIQL